MIVKIGNQVVGDRDVLVEHLFSSQPLIDHFIAHENGLRAGTTTHVKKVVCNHNIRGWRNRVRCPELYHVSMGSRANVPVKIMDMIAVNQRIVHGGEIKPV